MWSMPTYLTETRYVGLCSMIGMKLISASAVADMLMGIASLPYYLFITPGLTLAASIIWIFACDQKQSQASC